MVYSEVENNDDDLAPRPTRDEVDSLFTAVLAEWDARDPQVGDTIPKTWFYDQLGVTYPELANSYEQAQACEKKFVGLFYGSDGFRTYLLEHRKRFLKSNHARGFEVLPPEKQTGFAERQRRKDINKALRDEHMLLTHVDNTMLSMDQRRENEDAIARNAALARIFHRQRRPGFRRR